MNIHKYENAPTTGKQLLLWCSYLIVQKKDGWESVNKIKTSLK